MRKITSIVLAIITIAVSACSIVPRVNLNDQVSVSQNISVSRDDFEKITSYDGPNAATTDAGYDFVRLRAIKMDGYKGYLYQIYVNDYYRGEWRFYDSATDSNGNSLETILFDRKTRVCSSDTCSHTEQLGIMVSKEYLESNQNSGVKFRISGKRGSEVFYIPPGYIKGFLSYLNK